MPRLGALLLICFLPNSNSILAGADAGSPAAQSDAGGGVSYASLLQSTDDTAATDGGNDVAPTSSKGGDKDSAGLAKRLKPTVPEGQEDRVARELEAIGRRQTSGSFEDPFDAHPLLANADETIRKFSFNMKTATTEMIDYYKKVKDQIENYQEAVRYLANNIRNINRHMKVMLNEENIALELRNSARMQDITRIDMEIDRHHKYMMDPFNLDMKDPQFAQHFEDAEEAAEESAGGDSGDASSSKPK